MKILMNNLTRFKNKTKKKRETWSVYKFATVSNVLSTFFFIIVNEGRERDTAKQLRKLVNEQNCRSGPRIVSHVTERKTG